MSVQLSGHRGDDASNSKDMPFDFSATNYTVVEQILAKYPANYKQSAIIPLLDLAQVRRMPLCQQRSC